MQELKSQFKSVKRNTGNIIQGLIKSLSRMYKYKICNYKNKNYTY